MPDFLMGRRKIMRVPSEARKCVVFVGILDGDGVFRPKATAFLVATKAPDSQLWFPCLVSAQHVVSGLLTKGHNLFCRLNRVGGGIVVEPLKPDQWHYHPTIETDVAVAAVGINQQTIDHEPIPMPHTGWSALELRKLGGNYGLGDEVFIIGLFRYHFGRERNIPIVRIGNVAAFPEEPIRTEYCGFTDAYLIEARSIAGLSGSPVFLNRQNLISGGIGSLGIIDPRFSGPDPESIVWQNYQFLGIIHGHYDVPGKSEEMDADTDADESGGVRLNAGIGIVIPAERVYETLYSPDLMKMRRHMESELSENPRLTPDS